MLRKVVFSCAVFGLALASAKSYDVKMYEPAQAGNTELKAGDYQVSVEGQNAKIKIGKTETQLPVKVESADNKYNVTSVKYVTVNGKRQIQEIHLGGSKTRLVFTEAVPVP